MVRSQTRKIEAVIPEELYGPPRYDVLLPRLITKLFQKEEPPPPPPEPPKVDEEPVPVVTPEWMPTEQHHHYHTVYRTPRWIELTILGLGVVNLCLLVAHLMSP